MKKFIMVLVLLNTLKVYCKWSNKSISVNQTERFFSNLVAQAIFDNSDITAAAYSYVKDNIEIVDINVFISEINEYSSDLSSTEKALLGMAMFYYSFF